MKHEKKIMIKKSKHGDCVRPSEALNLILNMYEIIVERTERERTFFSSAFLCSLRDSSYLSTVFCL